METARKFLEVATLIEDESLSTYASVAASLAVLAGIAASDAACCKVLGRRSRGENHHDAERFLEEIGDGGKEAASALRRLVNIKDVAQYGMTSLSREQLKSAMRQAEWLVEFAVGLSRD